MFLRVHVYTHVCTCVQESRCAKQSAKTWRLRANLESVSYCLNLVVNCRHHARTEVIERLVEERVVVPHLRFSRQ